jgi:hypothetical protein
MKTIPPGTRSRMHALSHRTAIQNRYLDIFMDVTDKLKLIKIDTIDTGKKISFASFLRENYVAKSLVMYIDRNGIIEKMFLSSDTYGTVEWQNGTGLKNSHSWETEDEAKQPTYLTRRYTSILSDGAMDNDFAREKIIPDILDNLLYADIAEWVGDVLQVREYLVPVDLSRFN